MMCTNAFQMIWISTLQVLLKCPNIFLGVPQWLNCLKCSRHLSFKNPNTFKWLPSRANTFQIFLKLTFNLKRKMVREKDVDMTLLNNLSCMLDHLVKREKNRQGDYAAMSSQKMFIGNKSMAKVIYRGIFMLETYVKSFAEGIRLLNVLYVPNLHSILFFVSTLI